MAESVDEARLVTEISGVEIPRGERKRVDIPVAALPSGTMVHLPIMVVNGRRPGPRLWLSATVHGDELNGLEIVREVLGRLDPDELRGTLYAIPIVNVFGLIHQDRYLPDRRDLNRCFPGSASGSLASRLAYLFMKEIVGRCDYGIDLHTGSNDRSNLPQIRADLDDEETLQCARAFNAPAMIHAKTRDGSLRAAATKKGIRVLLYEAGEPLRFDPDAIVTGTRGTLNVMRSLGMLRRRKVKVESRSLGIRKTRWVRAKAGGILRLSIDAGDRVEKGQAIGIIGDAFGATRLPVNAPMSGLVIGKKDNPLVHMGDAIVHIGVIEGT